MYSLKEFFSVLDEYAPLKFSQAMIERGCHDNSGILINCNDCVKNVTFSLDLSKYVVEQAIKNGSDTIVTHHPAIYQPIKDLSVDGATAPVLLSAMNGLNVISMHLNLDVAKTGIDYCLANAVGKNNVKILETIEDGIGYGREFVLDTTVSELSKALSEKLKTDKIIYYGSGKVNKVATFCGGGSSSALELVLTNKTNADTIVTSDVPHHVIKEMVERDKNIIIIPHYVAEEVGFNKFYCEIKNKLSEKINAYYIDDKRFR